MTLNAYDVLERVRGEGPLVHHLTNWVTIFDCAQVVKCLGASPVMAHAPEEVADMTQLASALVLNIGTLTTSMVEAMKRAASAANKKGIPVVLDVCGAGATRLRDVKSLELLEAARIDIIKGNSSEIARISGEEVKTKGVDSSETGLDVARVAVLLARRRRAVVVITGATDVVTDGQRLFRVGNGHELMSRTVGTGCMAASVIGTFTAVTKDWAAGAAAALCCFGIAGELAAQTAKGPADFKSQLLDRLYALDRPTVEQRERIEARDA